MNRDGYAKNFSIQLIKGEWRLSPAYDLLLGSGFNGFHTTTVNNNGELTIASCNLRKAKERGIDDIPYSLLALYRFMSIFAGHDLFKGIMSHIINKPIMKYWYKKQLLNIQKIK